jgi:hypothetical protein
MLEIVEISPCKESIVRELAEMLPLQISKRIGAKQFLSLRRMTAAARPGVLWKWILREDLIQLLNCVPNHRGAAHPVRIISRPPDASQNAFLTDGGTANAYFIPRSPVTLRLAGGRPVPLFAPASGVDPAEVANLDKAKINVWEFVEEVVQRLKMGQGGGQSEDDIGVAGAA